jgi:hypothetical protein
VFREFFCLELATHCRRIRFKSQEVNLSQVGGQKVGVTRVGERLWLVTFMHDDPLERSLGASPS